MKREALRIMRAGESLTHGYPSLPSGGLDDLDWEILADTDLVQANLAGSLTWEDSVQGKRLRADLIVAMRELSGRAASAGMQHLADRLCALSDELADAED